MKKELDLEQLQELIEELREENKELKRQLMRHGKRTEDDNGDAIPLDKIFSGDV